MMSLIKSEISQTVETVERVLKDTTLLEGVLGVSELCKSALQQGNKIIFAGNGGSAADAQHLAAELVSRLNYDRPALAALSLTVDTSALTAIGNDYGYQYVFARQLDAIARQGDVFVAISTSGNSQNILEALQIAKDKKVMSVGLTGKSGGKMKNMCDHILQMPSTQTPKIQECHIMLGHIICDLIEQGLFPHLKPQID
jgi:D-sedoheptulose 7-phosphate isomerase